MNPSYRRRAVIACFKLFEKAEEYEQIGDFERLVNTLVERLEDTDQGVQISAIACV